jgi:hypothetical protein
MFAWKVKQLFRDQARELVAPSNNYSGANRRAINLMPLPPVNDGHEIAQTSNIRFHQLLISIEGNQRSCCLKVISPKKKSRSALLIFRGRVLGSLYGRKAMKDHVFAQDAHKNALTDLATPGNILDAYQLPEDLVLASASLFHGQILDFGPQYNIQELYQTAVSQIANFGLPGVVVVSTPKDELICMTYMSGGRLIGVYSSKDGWVESSPQAALRYINATPEAKIMGSVLAVRSLDDVAALGFSLTGLGDRRYDMWRKRDSLASRMPGVESAQIQAMDHYDMAHVQQLQTTQNRAIGYNQGVRRIPPAQRTQHAHSIRP